MSQYERVQRLWQSYAIKTPEDLDHALDSFRVLFAYHSGKIENQDIDYHDTREIFESGKVVGFTGHPRVLFEQQNQKLCYDFLRDKIISKAPLTAELIKEIHAALTAGTYDETRYIARGERPGAFRKHDYVTGIHEVGFPPEDVENAIADLLAEVNGEGIQDHQTAAAYLHARFEFIHPFADGNGRVGRTLLNYYLMTHDQPPLIVYDEDKRRYYHALEQYDANEEIEPLVDFLREETIKTWEKALQRSQGAPTRKRSLKDLDG